MSNKNISRQTLLRLPVYYSYLKSLPENSPENISSSAIAEALGINHVLVRKDLGSIRCSGRPRIGYPTESLINNLEHFLGFNDTANAVLVGAGSLGRALLSYDGFREYGLNIVAAFDINEKIIGSTINGKNILSIKDLMRFCTRLDIKMGIITVPAKSAQDVCDLMIVSDIKAVWNFSPVHLQVPEGVLVKNENMAYSLSMLSKHLKKSCR